MEHIYPSIIISHDKTLISIYPVEYLRVNHIEEDKYNYVILYNISYQSTDTSLSTTIPYYISDGKTNNLRAQLLFPFFCFEKGEQYMETCPSNKIYSNLKLNKYNIIKNINTDLLNDKIILDFITMIGPDKPTDTFLTLLKKYNEDHGKNLLSVSPRIGNILDLVICIFTKILCNYERYDIKIFRPLPINDDFDFTINQYTNSKSILSFDTLRLSILQNLKRINSTFLNYELVKIENINLQDKLKNITTQEFNEIISFCNEPSRNYMNMYNYNLISKKIYDIILNKVQALLKINPEDINLQFIFQILDCSSNISISNDDAYQLQKEMWGVCYRDIKTNINTELEMFSKKNIINIECIKKAGGNYIKSKYIKKKRVTSKKRYHLKLKK